jgi:hypothetical protein
MEATRACPECRGTNTKELGPTPSTITWFFCATCKNLWTAAPLPAQIDMPADPADLRPSAPPR